MKHYAERPGNWLLSGFVIPYFKSSHYPMVQLVDQILKAKTANPAADTSADEAEIDRLVCALYGTTDAEIAAVVGHG